MNGNRIGNRFDSLCRTVHSRRDALARLAGGLLVAGGLHGAAGEVEAAKRCPKGKKRCKKKCIPKHACCTKPQCQRKLRGSICRRGKCVCAAGTKVCQGRCIPQATCCRDGECEAGQACVAGRCCVPTSAALQAALNPGGPAVVPLCPDTIYEGTFTVWHNATVIGAGADSTVLDGGGSGPVVTVPSSVTGADLRGVKITQRTGTGRGLLNYGGVTLTECTVTGNQADGGGGIYNELDASLTLTRSIVSDNHAGSGGGGGINNRFGTVTLNESVVTGNESSTQRGGGILNNGGILTLVGSRVERNRTGGQGGGIYYSAAARPNSVTLRGGSIVTDNEADPNDPQSGGGIYNLFGNGTVEILDTSHVTGNRPNDCTDVTCPG